MQEQHESVQLKCHSSLYTKNPVILGVELAQVSLTSATAGYHVIMQISVPTADFF